MGNCLRIAQIAPLTGPIDPTTCRSIEHLVYLLTEELMRRGHDVTLFATGDSRTSARLHATYRRGFDADPNLWNWSLHESAHVAAAFQRADEFDLIHSHDYAFALPFTRLVDTPTLHTYHILPDEDVLRLHACYPNAPIAAISRFQQDHLAGLRSVGVVHHGIDTERFPFDPSSEEFLLFLGRLIPEKGPMEAITLAQQTGYPLVLAGPGDGEYFDSELRPLIDGRQVRHVGPVGALERNDLLKRAAALIYPPILSEPFGLVMIEAMACGTPVLALDIGAVPEIVEDGVTGFCAPDIAGLGDLLPKALALDRETIRQTAVERFDYRRMVTEYEAVYRRLVDERCGKVQ